jgi:prepilin-type N-terminal cleavage/methylation domain-containing protein
MNFFSKNKIIASALKNKKGGFTLIELLVVLVIFVVLTGVVLVNQNSFNNSELLNNFTYDVALTLKQAQTYAVNVQENVFGSFSSSYGVFFNIDPTPNAGGSNTNFILFNNLVSSDGNVTYDDSINSTTGTSLHAGDVTNCPTTNSECVQKYAMTNGLYISNICVTDSHNSTTCNVNQLSILFTRPNPSAYIYDLDNSSPTLKNSATITLSSAKGATSSVVITGTGQIYVQK